MAFHVPNKYRVREGRLASTDDIGNNGAFLLRMGSRAINVIASDGGTPAWEHVSVRVGGAKAERTATWEEMHRVKELFWDDEDTVVQFHPPKAEYVNIHNYVLHMWRKAGTNFETPPKEFV